MEKTTNYFSIELHTTFMPAQYFTITISVKYLISFETLIQDLSENDKIINGPVAF